MLISDIKIENIYKIDCLLWFLINPSYAWNLTFILSKLKCLEPPVYLSPSAVSWNSLKASVSLIDKNIRLKETYCSATSRFQLMLLILFHGCALWYL